MSLRLRPLSRLFKRSAVNLASASCNPLNRFFLNGRQFMMGVCGSVGAGPGHALNYEDASALSGDINRDIRFEYAEAFSRPEVA